MLDGFKNDYGRYLGHKFRIRHDLVLLGNGPDKALQQ